MDELAAAFIEPLVMQDNVDRLGGRTQLAWGGCPGIPKSFGRHASAEKARTMACRESDRLIQENNSVQLQLAMTARRRSLYSQQQMSHLLLAQRLVSSVFVAGSWMMPRLPVNMPVWGMATISPKGVTRF
jgi:hypothetical protein